MAPGKDTSVDNDPWLTSSQLERGLSLSEENRDATRADAHPDRTQSTEHNASNSNGSSAGHTAQSRASNSTNHSRHASGDIRALRERPRVRFGPAEPDSSVSASRSQSRNNTSTNHTRGGSNVGSPGVTGTFTPPSALRPHVPKPLPMPRSGSASAILDGSADITSSPLRSPIITRSFQNASVVECVGSDDEYGSDSGMVSGPAEDAFNKARSRAERLSRSLTGKRVSLSAPGSKMPSPETSGPPSPVMYGTHPPALPKDMTNLIPMEEVQQRHTKKYGIEDETDSEDEKARLPESKPKKKGVHHMATSAKRILHTYASGLHGLDHVTTTEPGLTSGQTTPVHDRVDPELYVPPPDTYRGGVLASLLAIRGMEFQSTLRPSSSVFAQSTSTTPVATPGGSPRGSPPSSGAATPKRRPPKWHDKSDSWGGSQNSSLGTLINSSNALATPAATSSVKSRPPLKQRPSSGIFTLGKKKPKDPNKSVFIRNHIEEILARQDYIISCCRALMKYGAPTHRLEEYMRYLARVLEIKGQFLYIPGCMLISFDDPSTHTTEMKIVRETQGVNLGKLLDMHDIYKAVTHDKTGVKEASEMLSELWERKQRYNPWICVLLYGFASAFVGPFAFDARPIDMPIAFILGSILGFMQIILAPRSELYSNVFEITAAVVTSFLARAFGSIRGGNLFCFSALAQSSIALILPGFMVLGAAMELQSRNIIAGSVRMVFAIIYSLFIGFGITIGTAFYGGMDSNATSNTKCSASTPMRDELKFLFVPFFTLCLILINQSKWRQAPAMITISFAGYIVNYYSAKRFASNAQVANTLGALAIGILGNLYSRFFQGMSAAAILPAIFVQVPSGLAASGSLISGINIANQINGNETSVGQGVAEGGLNDNGIVFNVGYSMIQIAVGLTVGLFFSSLIVYPLGKKRSGLFSF